MRSSLKSLVAVSAMLLVVPTFAFADDMGGGDDLQELLGRMSDLEQQLRATNDALAAANARVDQQASQLGKLKAPTGVMPALSDFLTQTEFSGWVSSTYFYNTNNPDNGVAAGTANNTCYNCDYGALAAPFKRDSNSFQVEQVWFAMENEATPESRAGFQVELAWGETADVLRGTEADNASTPYLYTANVSYLAPITPSGILVTAGRFATHIGAEVAQAPYNFNITRGIVYNLQPINHTGVKISSSYDNGLDWMLGVSNTAGYSGLALQEDTDDEKTFLWRIGYQMSDTLAVGINGLYGGDCAICTGPGANTQGASGAGRSSDKQGVIDMVVNWDPSDKLSMWMNWDYIWVDDEDRADEPRIFGMAIAGRYAITDTTGFALRGEYIHSWDNYYGIASNTIGGGLPSSITAVDHDLWAITATADHKLTEHLTVKAEVAYQQGSATSGSDNVFFVDENKATDQASDSQVLLGVQMLYEF